MGESIFWKGDEVTFTTAYFWMEMVGWDDYTQLLEVALLA